MARTVRDTLRAFTTLCSALLCLPALARAQETAPIIDVHLHAAWPDGNDEDELEEALLGMDANGIALALLFANEPDDVAHWPAAAPGRFLAGPAFPCVVRNGSGGQSCEWDGDAWPDLAWLRARYAAGEFRIMGEMLFVYAGVSPDDPRMEPYWSLAEEFDIPVGIHINRGPPAGAPPRGEGCCPDFNSELGDPTLLEPVLARHPELRIWLQHAGLPGIPPTGNIDYVDSTIAILKRHPNVFVDFSVLNSIFDAESHEAALRRFMSEGVGDRIMFGTDNMPAEPIIARINEFKFLTHQQRRGIFYDNAARFLRLDPETIAAHHSR